MTKPLVSNTGPVIALAIIEQVELLRGLFSTVRVAQSVHTELTQAVDKVAADVFSGHPWIEIVEDPPMPDKWLSSFLDLGEAATIALALQSENAVTLIDERKGRRVARDIYQLPIIGTAGLLLQGKQAGHLPKVGPLLRILQKNHYFIHDELIQNIERLANE